MDDAVYISDEAQKALNTPLSASGDSFSSEDQEFLELILAMVNDKKN